MSSDAQGGSEAATEPIGEPRRLRRTREHRLVAGVCSGLAEYFGLHPAIYRVIFVALTIAGGTGLLLYAAAALVIPAEGSDESLATQALREHRDRPWLVIGIGLLALGGIFALSGGHVLWGGGGIWGLALVAGALIVVWEATDRGRRARARRETPEPAGAPAPAPAPGGRDVRPSIFWPGLGLLLAIAGGIGLLDGLDVVDVDAVVVLAGGLILVGALVALGFVFRGAAPLGLVGIPLIVAVAAALALDDVSFRGGIGDRLERPATLQELDRDYHLGVGQLELDLSRLQLPPGETRVSARLGIGSLVVDVPDDVAVRVTSKVRGGNSDLLGREEDGWHVRQTVETGSSDANRRLVLDLTVGFGDVEVRE